MSDSFFLRIIRPFFRFFYQTLWLWPFVFFLFGYYIVQRTVGSRILKAPHLIGKNLHDTVRILAPYRLNLRILDEIEEPAMPEGTIIDQHPAPGAGIKIHQPLGIVISHRPEPPTAPRFTDLSLPEIRKSADKRGIRIKAHMCTSDIYPADLCIAQTPPPGAPLKEKTVNVYIAAHDTPSCLLPNFVGLPLDEVRSFLKMHNIPIEIVPHEHAHRIQSQACTIVAQKPLAGSFINRTNPPVIQLSVKQKDVF